MRRQFKIANRTEQNRTEQNRTEQNSHNYVNYQAELKALSVYDAIISAISNADASVIFNSTISNQQAHFAH